MKRLTEIKKGDNVAVISASSDLAGRFPWVLDLGIKRLRRVLGLVPIEYPTTRKLNATHREKALDINHAFEDKSIKAIFTTIGGEDQIHLLKYIDRELIRNNPKAFFGFSDNTNIAQLLWELSIPSYYGGSVMNQLAMPGSIHRETLNSLKNAIFYRKPLELQVIQDFYETDNDWTNKNTFSREIEYQKDNGWAWYGSGDVEGILWGGCVESLLPLIQQNLIAQTIQRYKNLVIFIETAEGIPEHSVIRKLLVLLGERQILSSTRALLVGRPKTWALDKQNTEEFRHQYKKDQRTVVTNTVKQYNPNCVIVQNLSFGHTHPQLIVPAGKTARILSSRKKIYFEY